MLTIRTLQPTAWETVKDLRIRAVTDSPDAFDPLDPELAASDDYWRRLTEAVASPGSDVLVVEASDNGPMGMAYVRIDEQRAGHIGAMWVDPHLRGSGVGRRLLAEAIAWHAAQAVQLIRLFVTEGNNVASSLYASAGFTFTGHSRLLREDDDLRILEMELRL